MDSGMARRKDYSGMQQSNDAADAQASFNDVFSLRSTFSQPPSAPACCNQSLSMELVPVRAESSEHSLLSWHVSIAVQKAQGRKGRP